MGTKSATSIAQIGRTEIEVGSRVLFHHSGGLSEGTVVEIKVAGWTKDHLIRTPDGSEIWATTVYTRPYPIPGMGGTIVCGSDRTGCTVVEVRTFKGGKKKGEIREIVVQEDKMTRLPSPPGGGQEYHYERQPDAPLRTFTLRRFSFKEKGGDGDRLYVGERKGYVDDCN